MASTIIRFHPIRARRRSRYGTRAYTFPFCTYLNLRWFSRVLSHGSDTAKVGFQLYARFRHHAGGVSPISLSQLADACGLRRQNVWRALKNLHRHNLVRVWTCDDAPGDDDAPVSDVRKTFTPRLPKQWDDFIRAPRNADKSRARTPQYADFPTNNKIDDESEPHPRLYIRCLTWRQLLDALALPQAGAALYVYELHNEQIGLTESVSAQHVKWLGDKRRAQRARKSLRESGMSPATDARQAMIELADAIRNKVLGADDCPPDLPGMD